MESNILLLRAHGGEPTLSSGRPLLREARGLGVGTLEFDAWLPTFEAVAAPQGMTVPPSFVGVGAGCCAVGGSTRPFVVARGASTMEPSGSGATRKGLSRVPLWPSRSSPH